jgi:hypothetical protein
VLFVYSLDGMESGLTNLLQAHEIFRNVLLKNSVTVLLPVPFLRDLTGRSEMHLSVRCGMYDETTRRDIVTNKHVKCVRNFINYRCKLTRRLLIIGGTLIFTIVHVFSSIDSRKLSRPRKRWETPTTAKPV